MAVIITCSGPVITDNQGRAECTTMAWTEVTYVPPLQASDIDPVTVAAFVGSGFFVLLPIWAAMYGGRVLINALKS